MQWGLFSLQIPAGLFCGGTRVCFFLRVHARAFFLWYSLYFVFGEGETPLLQRRCFSPSPTPSLSSSTGARRGVLHAAEFLCRSLQGASAVARAWCFTRGSPRGVYCVCTRGLFSLLFSVLCFLGRESRLPQFGYSLKTASLEQMFYCTAARWDVRNLPIAKFYFAVYPQRILPSASETLADCKFLVCRRQIKSLPTASVPLADGKIHLG